MVIATIQLNDKSQRQTDKVGNIVANDMLSPEMYS